MPWINRTIIRVGVIELIAIATLIFSLFYLGSSYQALATWYRGLGSCFYRSYKWSEIFFTPAVKKAGNIFAIIAILCSIALILFKSKTAFTLSKTLQYCFARIFSTKRDYIVFIAVIIVGTSLWLWGIGLVDFANDEIFSALNFASLPAFQVISYYPLPNNHIFFNLCNHFFSFFFSDPLFSGKIISLIFYILLVFGNYLFLKRFISQPAILYLILIVLALQFPVWGYGHQARGYAMYIFFEWLSFVTFYLYLSDKRELLLGLNLLANVIGIWIIPSFLYFIVFQVVAAALLQVIYKEADRRYWIYALIGAMLIFCVYLPLFCFSGLESLAANGYVKPERMTSFRLMQFFTTCHTDYIRQAYSINVPTTWGRIVLFFLPAILIFNRDYKIKLLGVLYFLLIMVTLCIILGMNRFPFNRNFSGHFHIMLLLALLLIYQVIHFLKKPAGRLCYLITFACFCSFFAWRWVRYDRQFVNEQLYYYDINGSFNKLYQVDYSLGNIKTVYLSEESFPWYYILKEKNKNLPIDRNSCNFNMQDICIIFKRDQLPAPGAYRLIIKEWDDYNIYEKKKDTREDVIEK